jgi:L-aspartate oxidase
MLADVSEEIQALEKRLARTGLMSESIATLHEELQGAANRHPLIVRTASGLQSLIDICASLNERLQRAPLATPADRVLRDRVP